MFDLLSEAVAENPATSLVRKKAYQLIDEIRQDGNSELADVLEKNIKIRTANPDMGTYKNYWNHLARIFEPDTATGGGKDMHAKQYSFLVNDCGLKPGDVFLDIGTGSLRGTRDVITYLKAGHFHGMDVSEELISFSKKRVSESIEMYSRQPKFCVDDRFRFSSIFPDTEFDFAFAKSVFTHVYPDAVWDCLVQLRKVISQTGRFYGTIFKNNSINIYKGDVRKMYYNTDWLAETAQLAGWKLEEIGETKVGQYMCLFVPR
ncbi:MAG: class I SAM-dependent methyltransferase [Desulfonatronovibrio sp.]